MKYLRKFNEASKIPLYSKGEVLVFTNDGVTPDFIGEIAKKLGCSIDRKYDIGDNVFLIKTEVGMENTIGQDFVDNYPEFFNNFERRDLNIESMFDLIDDIVDDVKSLDNYVGGKSINSNINRDIDDIIAKLNSLKV